MSARWVEVEWPAEFKDESPRRGCVPAATAVCLVTVIPLFAF
jgi:hypothetical protein